MEDFLYLGPRGKRTNNYQNLDADNKKIFTGYLDCISTCKNVLEETYMILDDVDAKTKRKIKEVLTDIWDWMNNKKECYGGELLEDQEFVVTKDSVVLSEREVKNDPMWHREPLDLED